MKAKFWSIVAVGGVVLIWACNSTPTEPPSATLVITTEKSVYSVKDDYGATPMLINLGPDTVYGPMSEYVYVEKYLDGAWVNRQPWFTVDGIGVSFPVAPNDTLRAITMGFGYVGRSPGTYRFVFYLAYDPKGRRPVPEALRVSAAFDLIP